jgi:hypothetical protein
VRVDGLSGEGMDFTGAGDAASYGVGMTVPWSRYLQGRCSMADQGKLGISRIKVRGSGDNIYLKLIELLRDFKMKLCRV